MPRRNGKGKHQRLQVEGVLSSRFTIAALSFTVVLRGNSEEKKEPDLLQDVVGGLIYIETSINEQKRERNQPSELRTEPVEHQAMTGFKRAEREARGMAITKFVSFIMEQNGQLRSTPRTQ
jgi:hypothetical protein